jgi:acetyl-CoA carboxylase biotin carboxyl carrier protein
MADHKSAMHVDTALVRQLAELLDETGLSEIEVEDGDRKVRVARNLTAGPAPVAMAAPIAAPVAAAATTPAAAPAANAVKSPMVGTVYLSAEPGSKPFASVGDTVAEGDTLVIIEAMKVMNPIPATRAGKVTQVLVENGQPVEFDQPLIVIE